MTKNNAVIVKKRKKVPLFWKIFITVVVGVLLLIHIVLFWINGFLKDFEAAQPKHVAEEVFKTYFSDFSASRYLDICEDSTAKYELRENLITYLDALTKDEKITYYSVSTGMDDGLQYVVRAGDTKFASFTLEKDIGDKESRFTRYKPGRFALYTDAKTKVDVEIPTGYTLYLNGVEVSHEYIIQEGIETPSCAHMPQDVAGTTLEKYKVAGFIQPPAVEVYSPNGQKALVEEGNNGAYKASVVADPQLADQYSSWFIEAATKYAIYMQYDSKVAAMRFGSVAPYFDPDSKLYEDIRTVENGFVIEYERYEIKDEKASDFIRYDENTFSCRVTLTHILYRRGMDDYIDHIDITFYARQNDGVILIYDMDNN